MALSMATLTSRMGSVTLSRTATPAKLGFSANIGGAKLAASVQAAPRASGAFVIQAAQNAKARIKRSEAQRQYNKSYKSEAASRLKSAMAAFEASETEDDLLAAEKLASAAFKVLDKCVSKGILHKNTVSRRKSRISRSKQRVSIAKGWYTPSN